MAVTFDEIIKKFPAEVQGYVRSIWDSLSPAEQANLLKLTEGIPTEASLVKLLIQLSSTQLKQTFGKRAGQVGQFVRADHDQGDGKNDNHFRQADSKHG